MTGLQPFLDAVTAALPDGVSMSYRARPEQESVSLFFAGPRGVAACPMNGCVTALAAGDIAALRLKAAVAAEKVA